ncbi:2Fe-2S iron-sulfur cluster-binding protein [Streptomyces sp. NPDC058326]|uniref:2Fe-2S iron-sulfur cluster-binding protein n=1 Tax=Streptomyces sp. NPDC058326 TaxID=3346447 RepID=UPI0036E54C34
MSSNDQQHQNAGGWEPIPQSEGYDGDATAFVQLPPDFMLDGVPLEAPGHGYVPPMITPLQPLAPSPATDPSATGSWTVHVPTRAEQTQYFDGSEYTDQDASAYQRAEHFPQQGERAERFGHGEHFERPEHVERPEHFEPFGPGGTFGRGEAFGQAGRSAYVEGDGNGGHGEYAEQDPHATAEWRFTEVTAPAAGPGTTGQWEIPVVPDTAEAAEAAGPGQEPDGFAASAVRPYAEAPATLPGGAPAPWALPAEPVEEPAAEAPGETPGDADEEPGAALDAGQRDGEAAAAVALEGTPGEGAAEEQAAAAPDHAPGDEPGLVSDQATDQAMDHAPGHATDQATDHVPAHAPDQATGHAPAHATDTAEGLAPDPAHSATSAQASTDSDEHPHTSYTLRVNGADRPVTGSWIGESLLYVLRERLGLAGAKDGCSQGECGACNVQVDGRLVASCLVPAATAAGSEVRTVEGLATDGEPSDVQRAMAKCGTVQCGFCIPGMCMTVHDLLEGNHAPTELEARQALAGNLCRCSGYRGVLEAVRDVVAEREASAAATAPEGADEPRVPHQIPHPHDGGMA